MKRFSVVIAVAALTGCTMGTPAQPTRASAELVAQAKAAVTANARDPESLKFGEAAAYKLANGETAVCIRVNGRNAFGGYTGYQTVNVNLRPSRQPIVFFGQPGAAECAGLAVGSSMRM